MKILSVQLWPFGAVENRQFDLADGLQVFVGPNEAGKSTLCQAILHGLFTSVDLPPKAREKAISMWYPRGGGDHAKVILKLRVSGDDWTLDKQWAQKERDCRCSLRGPGLQLVDAAKVNEKLAELVGTGRAVWERILVTSQSELNSTLERLRDSKKTEGRDALDAVRQASRGLRAVADDVSPEVVGRIIDDKVDAAWSNWNRASNGPCDGRGIGREWVNKVGHVLGAYYKVEKLKAAMRDAALWEAAYAKIEAEERDLKREIRREKEWRSRHQSVRDDIGDSKSRIENLATCEQHLNSLKNEMNRWENLIEEQGRLQAELHTLDQNRAQLRAEWARMVVKCAEELRVACELRDNVKAPSREQIKEAQSIERLLVKDRTQLDASTCRVRIQSIGEPQEVLFIEGLSEPERVHCESGVPLERSARAGFRIETRHIKITAELGKVDLEALRESVASRQEQLSTLLIQWKVDDVQQAIELTEMHEKCAIEVQRLETLFKGLLDGKSVEEWAAIAADAAPATDELRDITKVRGDVAAADNRWAAVDAKLRRTNEDLDKLTNDNVDLVTLKDKRVKASDAVEAARSKLGMVIVPSGFATADEFLEKWNAQPTQIEALEIEREEKRAELTRHERNAPRRSEDELVEDLRVAERELEREREAGESWLRIQAAFQSVVDAQDPLAATTDAVDSYLRSITADRYRTKQVVDGVVCTVAGGPAGEMDVDMLSYGTGDALALATRLGLGKTMIPEGEGVLILDDPLTEMDRERQQCASQAIVEFARTRQVVVFTCRDEDAQLLHGDHVRVTRLESRL